MNSPKMRSPSGESAAESQTAIELLKAALRPATGGPPPPIWGMTPWQHSCQTRSVLRRSTLAVLCALLSAIGPVRAAPPEAAPETRPVIILQLPPTMSADEVAKLTADLRAKGAVAAPAETPATAAPGTPVLRRVAERLRRAMPALGRLGGIGEAWRSAGGEDAGPYFWPRVAALFLAALAVEAALRLGLPLFFPSLKLRSGTPLRTAVGLHFLSLSLGLIGFVCTLRGGSALLSGESPLLRDTVERICVAGGNWRISMALLSLMAAPRAPAARLLRIGDEAALRIIVWVSAYLLLATLLAMSSWLPRRLDDVDLALAVGFVFGLAVLAFKIAMFLALRSQVAHAILVPGGDAPGMPRRVAARIWHWVFIGLSVAIFCLAVEEFSIGNNPRAAIAATALQTALVGMALAWAAKQRLLADIRNEGTVWWWLPAASRLVDMTVLLGGSFWLARVWGYDLLDAPAGSVTATALRPLFKATAFLLASWLAWTLIDGFLGERLIPARQDAANPHQARLATLLPLVRNSFAVAIFFVGGILALGAFGVDIGPLLAGAGVVGIALGFGAQALVHDVIAGLFFLIDDAFRLGETIDTGKLKGTVEAISIRAVRLRHKSGEIHTVPFGLIQAVTNSSRDWAVGEFVLHVAPGCDLQLVHDTIEKVGANLLEDPDIGQDFIHPLQMQGVSDVTHAALQIRCKFTARPGRQSRLQHRALHEIILSFAEAGIAFASPPTHAPSPN